MCSHPTASGSEDTNALLSAILGELQGLKANQFKLEQKVRSENTVVPVMVLWLTLLSGYSG